MDIIATLTKEFSLKESQIDEGNTIPFIARYRKEVTGSLDDTVLRDLFDRLTYLRNIEKRKEEVRASITSQEKMTPEIEAAIEAAQTLTEVEDIYRPFKPHRKTRASVAREKGLEPLATLIFEQKESYDRPIEEIAADYIDAEKGVEDVKAALDGACDIIAEDVSDNAEYRKNIRALTYNHAMLTSKAAKEEDSVYAQYYDYSEKVRTIPGHRILALNRGEKEDFLKVSLEISSDIILN